MGAGEAELAGWEWGEGVWNWRRRARLIALEYEESTTKPSRFSPTRTLGLRDLGGVGKFRKVGKVGADLKKKFSLFYGAPRVLKPD